MLSLGYKYAKFRFWRPALKWITCAALLRCVILFCNESSRKYSKGATKSSLKEIKNSFLRDVVSKFGSSFNKCSFSIDALTDTAGAFSAL